MNTDSELPRTDDAQTLRSALRADLVTAMRSRQPDVVAALRTTLSAIDNAEAVGAAPRTASAASEHVAGSRTGVGSTEAERRVLSLGEVRALVRAQIRERDDEAHRLDTYGRHDLAHRLRREADALRKYVDA